MLLSRCTGSRVSSESNIMSSWVNLVTREDKVCNTARACPLLWLDTIQPFYFILQQCLACTCSAAQVILGPVQQNHSLTICTVVWYMSILTGCRNGIEGLNDDLVSRGFAMNEEGGILKVCHANCLCKQIVSITCSERLGWLCQSWSWGSKCNAQCSITYRLNMLIQMSQEAAAARLLIANSFWIQTTPWLLNSAHDNTTTVKVRSESTRVKTLILFHRLVLETLLVSFSSAFWSILIYTCWNTDPLLTD